MMKMPSRCTRCGLLTMRSRAICRGCAAQVLADGEERRRREARADLDAAADDREPPKGAA